MKIIKKLLFLSLATLANLSLAYAPEEFSWTKEEENEIPFAEVESSIPFNDLPRYKRTYKPDSNFSPLSTPSHGSVTPSSDLESYASSGSIWSVSGSGSKETSTSGTQEGSSSAKTPLTGESTPTLKEEVSSKSHEQREYISTSLTGKPIRVVRSKGNLYILQQATGKDKKGNYIWGLPQDTLPFRKNEELTPQQVYELLASLSQLPKKPTK